MDRVERLTNLLLVLLDAQQPLTLQQIVHTVEGYPTGHDAYRQAFERDKRTLREEGIVVSVEPVAGTEQFGYRIRPDDYYLPDLGLTDEEQHALNLAVAAVRVGGMGAQQAAWRLGAGVADAPLAELPSLPALPVFHEAIRARLAVSFRHRGVRRTVDPYGLVFRNGSWYLVGRDHARNALRSFRVDRVEDVPSADPAAKFEPPAGLDPRSAVPGDPWTVGEGEAVTVRVVVDRVYAPMAVAELGEDAVKERRADGSVVVALSVLNTDAFRSWILGMLDHAEVLEPPAVRQELVSWLSGVAG